MNVKDLVKGMDKKKVYRWVEHPFGGWVLFGESGRTMWKAADRYEMEAVTKKLRGKGMNVIVTK